MNNKPTYQDISLVTNNAYKLASFINGGNYNNILYYEFHETVNVSNISNCLEGLKAFANLSSNYYKIFLSNNYIDEEPATIHIAVKLANEWFIAHDCGSNYYLGYGPKGILKLREACAINNIAGIVSNDNFKNWLKQKFESQKQTKKSAKINNERLQFEKLIKHLQFLTSDMQKKPDQYQELTEENIRDRMLTSINGAFNGRGFAEAKNNKGKTDILVKTEDGLNEHIFELKVWKGRKTLENTITQIQNYLSWHNNHCGIIMFCYRQNFSSILKIAEKYLIKEYNYSKQNGNAPNEFRFRIKHPTDKLKNITTHLIFVNLKQTENK